MTDLIIGMDGFIGRRLCGHLPDALKTSRRPYPLGVWHFDLLKPEPPPKADTIYICAGVNGNLACSLNPQMSYRANVDGTIWIVENARSPRDGYRPFIVWISSTTVEWLTEHYGTQKRIVENHLRSLGYVGMVRAGRVLESNVDDLCRTMIDIGHNRRSGITLWGEDEKPYQH